MIKEQIMMHQQVVESLINQCIPSIEKIADICNDAIKSGHKILLCGNGGSAADSQHIAAEFVGRFVKERISLPAIALTTDTSILTAVGNDYGYDEVFRRQVEGLGNSGDVLIGISTSGNSKNVLAAFEEAKKKGISTIAFTGMKTSRSEDIADVTLKVPSLVTLEFKNVIFLSDILFVSILMKIINGTLDLGGMNVS